MGLYEASTWRSWVFMRLYNTFMSFHFASTGSHEI